ncbi:hypothetical protein OIU34_21855 [Pararhizobium sp. BT-229]|uniref:hypothetical protein n=1 Tax=Pararhizobium sp. BT-229 TaxID=2986923 RepID=UPI0021F7ABA5|nr:hypothetical protein [Pararhizobium sp. BT-229]MCV9964539.1 hypothetical protein [Pararhizobium sp. BT-229]
MRLRLILPALVLLSATPTNAGLLDEAWGVVTDPLKIGKGTDNIIAAVERAMIHIERIQEKLGKDANQIMDRVDKTIGDTRKDIFKMIDATGGVAESVTNNAFAKLTVLQTSMIKDVRELVKCSTEVTLFQAQTALSRSLNELGERKPRIEIFGWTVLTAKIDPQDIDNPMQAYRRIKALYQTKLNAVTEKAHPQEITDIYGELQRISDLTRCHYKSDTGLFDELYWTEIEYNRLEKPWRGKVEL